MEKIILDTDIGSDIDDAFCLGYLLRQPQCQLLGITTVSGESVKRAMMASAMCKAAGRDVLIYPGVERPLLGSQKQGCAPQADALSRWDHEEYFTEGTAVEFLRQTIRNHPGEITLMAIGPMTNIALLFAVDPEIPSLLKNLVLMCGVFAYKLPDGVSLLEWNALCDPHAAAMVYRAPAPNIRSVGLDVTKQLIMPVGGVKERLTSDLGRLVLDFTAKWEGWKDGKGCVCFHDPLAAVTVFDDGICSFERGDVEVELESSRLMGLTSWEMNPEGKNEVAFTVDSGRFYSHFFEVFQ